jgi:hypothetical protein
MAFELNLQIAFSKGLCKLRGIYDLTVNKQMRRKENVFTYIHINNLSFLNLVFRRPYERFICKCGHAEVIS